MTAFLSTGILKSAVPASATRVPAARATDGGLVEGAIMHAKYVLEAPCATGRRSVVWRASHLTLQRPCALKVYDAGGETPRAAHVRATASVSHRHLIAIHDVFMVPSGNLYVVAMPFLEGETLQAFVARRGIVSIPDASRLVAQIADLLVHLHERELFHPGVTTQRIFLAAEGGGEIVAKLTGLVRPFADVGGAGGFMGAEAVRTLASLFVRCTASVPPFVEPMLAENSAARPTLENTREAFREIATRFVRPARGSKAHPTTSEG